MPELYEGPTIDAHHHVWDLDMKRHPWLSEGVLVSHRYGDYTPIKHTYTIEDYLNDVRGLNVVGSVYMEAEWDPLDPVGETEYIHEVFARTGYPGAMAAQAWLDRFDVKTILTNQAAHPLVRSVRHKPGGPSSPDQVLGNSRSLLSDPKWLDGYALLESLNLHFELQTPWWNLWEAKSLAKSFPNTTIIVNHSGVLLGRSASEIAAWRDALKNLAGCENVVIKASGLCCEGLPWSTELISLPIRNILSIFGSERVMFGSNFPVDKMFVSYSRLLADFKMVVAFCSSDEQENIFYKTAKRVYDPELGARDDV